MATIFSETLVKLRKAAGFPTAYRFYHDNGGAAALKVTYRNYLMMEQGHSLPVAARLERLLIGLRLLRATPESRELTLAWLKTMLGEELNSRLIEPLLAAPAPGRALSPADEALRRTMAERKYHMTEKQLLATISSFETYKCAFTLETDSGVWTAEALAKALRIRKPVAARALKDLLRVGLVKAEGKAGYRSKIAGQLVEYPSVAVMGPGVWGKLRGYLDRLEQESPVEFSNMGMIRADSEALRGYFPILTSNVEAAHAYSTSEKTPKSAGFYVVARVHRLWDF